jgi:uncharacterized membrane-anchored protein YhcB (DUF1043 family)
MEYAIAVSWFIVGLVIGVVGTISFVMFLGDREIRKRSKRSTDWQMIKKKIDKEFREEMDRR